MNDSKHSSSANEIWESTLPLSTRTERRLKNMASFTRQRMPTSFGFTPAIQEREEEINAKGRYLVELIREWEERKSGPVA